MDKLVRCFFPGTAACEVEEIDETFLSFIEEAVKSGESTKEDLVALVQSVVPDCPVHDNGLDERIDEYRSALLAVFDTTNNRGVAANTNSTGICSVLFSSETKENDVPIGGEDEEDDGRLLDVDSEASLEILRGVCGLSDKSQDDVLIFLMSRVVLGDADDTARWLLDHSFEEARQLKFAHDKANLARQKADAEKERIARERIVRKFDEKAEPLNGSDEKLKVSRKQKSLSEPQESKIRYLDGKVVATNGAKYIEIQQKEEWDGGSRGRVKTKGKRGTGWAT